MTGKSRDSWGLSDMHAAGVGGPCPATSSQVRPRAGFTTSKVLLAFAKPVLRPRLLGG